MWLEGEERSRRFPETTLTAQKCGIVHPVKTEDPENGTLRNGPYVGNKYMGVPPPHPQDIWEDPPPSSAGDERTGVMLQIANKNASVKKSQKWTRVQFIFPRYGSPYTLWTSLTSRTHLVNNENQENTNSLTSNQTCPGFNTRKAANLQCFVERASPRDA